MSLPSRFFFENAKIWVGQTTLNGEKKGMALRAESRSILKGHFGASSVEEWNVQKLSDSGNPCRDGGPSDKLRCQIL